jgi:hypothetical protein
MTETAALTRRRALALVVLCPVLLLLDAGLVAIASLVWGASAQRYLTAAQTAPFTVLAAGAIVGVLGYAVVIAGAVAVLRRRSAVRAATVAWTLAWLRVLGVVAAAVIVTAAGGDLSGMYVFVMALVDALVALFVCGGLRGAARRP